MQQRSDGAADHLLAFILQHLPTAYAPCFTLHIEANFQQVDRLISFVHFIQ